MMERQGKKSFASEARHKIDIQCKTYNPDGEGGGDMAWTTIHPNVSAAIYPIRASQVFEYKSIGVDATHLIKTRAYIPISEKDRILFQGRIFEILTIENLQESNYINVITCKEAR
jgi:SPP1 family predicted phage head-tail adaptor